MKGIVNRLKRVEGQLNRVHSDIDAGISCTVLIPQLLATKGALDAALKEYIMLSLRDCAHKKNPAETTLLLETIIKKL
jgi:DNA-binding FrmR family transcriptional regulator